MWVYYYIMHGPGHQGTDDGFQYYTDDYSKECIRECMIDRVDNYSNCSIEWWPIDKPPTSYIERKIKNANDSIKNLRRSVKRLKATETFDDSQEDGEDETLKRNISGTVELDLLKKLHKAGLTYTHDDLRDWWWKKKKILNPIRNKVLRIMRRSKKFPSYGKK